MKAIIEERLKWQCGVVIINPVWTVVFPKNHIVYDESNYDDTPKKIRGIKTFQEMRESRKNK